MLTHIEKEQELGVVKCQRVTNRGTGHVLDLSMTAPSGSSWASSVLKVKTTKAELGSPCDFQQLTDVIFTKVCALVRTGGRLYRLGNVNYFAIQSLASAFWRVPLRNKPESPPIWPPSYACFSRDGCQSVPDPGRVTATFQRAMNKTM